MLIIYCNHILPNICDDKQRNTPQALKCGINIYHSLEYANHAKQAQRMHMHSLYV